MGISGSGNSANVLNAARLAHELGLTTIGFIGFQGGNLATLVDVPIIAPNTCMEQIEDIHMFLTTPWSAPCATAASANSRPA